MAGELIRRVNTGKDALTIGTFAATIAMTAQSGGRDYRVILGAGVAAGLLGGAIVYLEPMQKQLAPLNAELVKIGAARVRVRDAALIIAGTAAALVFALKK